VNKHDDPRARELQDADLDQVTGGSFTPAFTGGVRVAAGDVNGDGRLDVVTGAGPGATAHVK
jgi:hypothetical protein